MVKQYKTLFDMENVDLEFTDSALVAIAKKAIELKTGARGLRAIMEEVLLNIMYEIPDKKGVSKVVIDDEVICGKKPAVYVYAEGEKSA